MGALNVVQMTINNEAIGIKPNTFEFTPGRGDRRVRTKMSGNNKQTVLSVDKETEFSKVMFTLITETDTAKKIMEWQDNFDANVIVAQDDGGNTYTFNQAILLTDPSIKSGVDGETPIEFQSETVAKG